MRTFVGKVARKRVARGSKSEHDAVVLKTPSREYVLRLADGNPFKDPRLERLVGKTVRCTGEVAEDTLIASEVAEVKGTSK